MNIHEPPQCPDPSLFFIGKNGRGQWIVQDQSGSRGGIFVNRTEALKFAMFENGNRPQAVVMVPGLLDIDFTNGNAATRSSAFASSAMSRHAA